MVISATSISEPSTTKLIPPQRKKSLSVSTSETTRLTRLPRRSSLWWAMLSAWMWRKVRVRSAAKPRSAAPARRRPVARAHRAVSTTTTPPAIASAGEQCEQHGEADAHQQLGRDRQAAPQHTGASCAGTTAAAQPLLDRLGG